MLDSERVYQDKSMAQGKGGDDGDACSDTTIYCGRHSSSVPGSGCSDDDHRFIACTIS